MIRLSYLITGAISFLVTAIVGGLLIPWLKKMNFGQTILTEYIDEHKQKQGTPVMGGIMFYIGITVSLVVGMSLVAPELKAINGFMYENQKLSLIISLATAVLFGAVGFADDYIKVVKKRNLGLVWYAKIAFQVFIAAGFLFMQSLVGHISTLIQIPFTSIVFDLGMFYYPIAFLGVIFMVNAVNLTDGIDGLSSSVTVAVSVGLMMISAAYGFYTNALFCMAVAGGCIGFLVWNYHPAKVFMGDTGSMFLGGCVVSMIWAVSRPELIIFSGIVYICEALSVMIQMSYFKITKKIYGEGRRIFKKTPIHHSFQMSGWSEEKIVLAFTLARAIFSLLAYLGY